MTDNRIRFTQYMVPSGREEDRWIERDGDALSNARTLEAAGFVFEAEVLMDIERTVSFEVLHAIDRDDSIGHALVANGPGVPAAIDRMFAEACAVLARRSVA
jgi:hypothetical protein